MDIIIVTVDLLNIVRIISAIVNHILAFSSALGIHI